MSYYLAKGAVKLEVSDFLTSGTKEFLQVSLILELERQKKMNGG